MLTAGDWLLGNRARNCLEVMELTLNRAGAASGGRHHRSGDHDERRRNRRPCSKKRTWNPVAQSCAVIVIRANRSKCPEIHARLPLRQGRNERTIYPDQTAKSLFSRLTHGCAYADQLLQGLATGYLVALIESVCIREMLHHLIRPPKSSWVAPSTSNIALRRHRANGFGCAAGRAGSASAAPHSQCKSSMSTKRSATAA